MTLMFTIMRESEVGEGKSVHRLEATRIRLGSAADAELSMAELPEVAAVIEPAGSRFKLTPTEGVSMKLEGEPVSGVATVRNGDVLEVGPYTIRLNVVFPTAAQQKRVSLLPALAAGLVALVLLGEIAIGVWLPMAVRARNRFGVEISRQRTFYLVDYLRGQTGGKQVEALDLRSRAALNLVRAELDRMTFYLRKYEHQLDAQQLSQLCADLNALREDVRQIREGTFFKGPSQLDYQQALEKLLQTPGDELK